jgi:hypothetical protein
MSVVFQISISRVLTPAEGQVKLAEIHAAAQQQNISGVGYIRVAGATVHDNPFPAWLTEQLCNNIPGLQFDDVNFFFHRLFETLEEAQHYERWIRENLTSWASADPAKMLVMNKLQTRIMRDHVGMIPSADIDVF